MREKIIILLVFVLIGGCSVFRVKKQNSVINTKDSLIRLKKDFQKANLTKEPFYIKKVEAKVINGNDINKFLASIKFHPPDSFLISIKSTSGIEAARIFVTNDTILINDKVNRILFYGSKTDAKNKYGISITILPVIVGDIVLSGDKLVYENCEGGFLDLKTVIDLTVAIYTIDCNNIKPIALKIISDINTKQILVKYLDYYIVNGMHVPKELIITDLQFANSIFLKYSKIEIPWLEDLKFIPGRNFDMVEMK